MRMALGVRTKAVFRGPSGRSELRGEGLKMRFHGRISSGLSSLVRGMGRLVNGGEACLPGDHPPGLGQAFAVVPHELDLMPAARFRVLVLGKQRALKPSLQDEIYGIGREAIMNAFRHSRAREIEIEIEYWPARLRMAVRDNGCGIDPRELQSAPKAQRGLVRMGQRAERIGARLRVLSRIACGTEVELCVAGRDAFE